MSAYENYSELQSRAINHLISQGMQAEEVTQLLDGYSYGVAYIEDVGAYALLTDCTDDGLILPALFSTFDDAVAARIENDGQGEICMLRWSCFDDIEAHRISKRNEQPTEDNWIGSASVSCVISG